VVEAADQGQGDDAAVVGWLDGSRLGASLSRATPSPTRTG